MATTSSNALAQNLEQLVAAFVRSSQELVLAAVMLLKRAGRVRIVGERGAMRYFPTARSAKAA